MLFRTKEYLLIILAISFCLSLSAQTSVNEVPKGWHLKDPNTDSLYGISLDKAYDFVKNKKSQTVIVAVIVAVIDTLHEDIKSVLWVNPKEIPGNGIDDDHNGYIDDIHGWNFIGGKDGSNLEVDYINERRFVYHKFKSRFEKIKKANSVKKKDLFDYEMWKGAERILVGQKMSDYVLQMTKKSLVTSLGCDSILKAALEKENYTRSELEAFSPSTDMQIKAKDSMFLYLDKSTSMAMTNIDALKFFKTIVDGEEKRREDIANPPKDYRGEIVKDDYSDLNDRFYGNNDIMTKNPFHGTQVSGVIAATRNNSVGMDGIADNVKIMSVRVLAKGGLYDKDIALAIRYAVDNGASVINMSFGASFSTEKSWVDDAVKYAAGKGVLLVHGAGNNCANIDTVKFYPSSIFKNMSKRADNWITAGASGSHTEGIVAGFSNYGKKEVDVFAPGVNIYSTTIGGNTYENVHGTSFSSAVVTGIAAFILSYYPELTARQLKYIIEKSVIKPKQRENAPLFLVDACATGGIVNAYEAINLADSITNTQMTDVKK